MSAEEDSAASLAARYEAELSAAPAAPATGGFGGFDASQFYSMPNIENNNAPVQSEYSASSAAPSSGGFACRSCGEFGHLAKFCPNQICKKCSALGHPTKDCPEASRIRVAPDENDSVYISDLPSSVDESSLLALFGSIGQVRFLSGKGPERFKKIPQIVIYRDKNTNAPKGDALVTYEDPASAPAAVQFFNGTPFGKEGKIIKVQLAEKKKQEETTEQGGRGGGFHGGQKWRGRGGGGPFRGGGFGGHRDDQRGRGPSRGQEVDREYAERDRDRGGNYQNREEQRDRERNYRDRDRERDREDSRGFEREERRY